MAKLPCALFFCFSLCGVTGLLGCPASVSGTGPNLDASPDTAVADAGAEADALDAAEEPEAQADAPSACNPSNCGGACCGDVCMTRTCTGCAVGAAFCPFFSFAGSNGYCASDCLSCQVGGVTTNVSCVSCAAFGGPTTYCTTDPSQCPQDKMHGACPCSLDGGADEAGACPDPAQVCTSVEGGAPVCLTH